MAEVQHNKEPREFEEKVIQVSRVSKKTKGGNKMGFSVLMVVGDKKGRVGVGLGKAKDVQSAVKKGVKKAKKRMLTVPMNGTTIPFRIEAKLGAGVVMLKPAPKGSGVIAGGPVRAVVEAAGIRDISSKIMGSSNQASSVYATFEALKQIARIVELKGLKLKSIAQVEAAAAEQMQETQAKAQEKATQKNEKSKELAGEEKKKTSIAKKPVAMVKKPIAAKKPLAAKKPILTKKSSSKVKTKKTE